jgi:ribosome-binding factor A
VADAIRRVLAGLLQGKLRDPRIGFVTLTDLKLSPDLRHAVAYVTLIDARCREDSLAALNRAVPFLRRTLAADSGLRFTPQLRFVYDAAEDGGQRVETLLERIRRERSDPEDAPENPDPARKQP